MQQEKRMTGPSVSRRVACLEAHHQNECITYILTAPSGNVLIIDQNPGEDLVALQRRVREAWLADGNEPELLPPKCQHLAGATQ